MDLYQFQSEVIGRVYQKLIGGRSKVLMVSPTGSGKTVMTGFIMKRAVELGRRVIFLCHRGELIDQTRKTFLKVIPNLDMGVMKGKRGARGHESVIIASVQTIVNRMDMIYEDDVIIIDEAHTVSYFKAARMLLEESGRVCIGVTATPRRTAKREGLGDLYEVAVKAPAPKELMEMGFLCPARTLGYPKAFNLSKVRMSRGDYKNDDLSVAVNSQESIEFVVRETRKHIGRRCGIAFCVDVQHAENMAREFSRVGMDAEAVTGANTDGERAVKYAKLEQRRIRVLCSVMVLTEGFDVKSVDVVVLARPTMSWALNAQMVGRGLRTFEGKDECLVLDFAANYLRHGLADQITSEEMEMDYEDPRKGEAPARECPKCEHVQHTCYPECKECGYVFPKKKEVKKENLSEGLIEIKKSGSEYCKSVYGVFMRKAVDKGYKPGWAGQQFKRQFKRHPTRWEKFKAAYDGDLNWKEKFWRYCKEKAKNPITLFAMEYGRNTETEESS